jgi:hypothetical protein
MINRARAILDVASSRETERGCKEHKFKASQREVNSPAAETPLAPIVRRSWWRPSAEAGNCEESPKTNLARVSSMMDETIYTEMI